MSAPILQILQAPAGRAMMRGSYTPRGGIPRGFYWDPSKGGEVVLDPEPAPLRMHQKVVVGAGANESPRSIAIGAGTTFSNENSVVVGAGSRLADEINRTERRIDTLLERPIAIGTSPPASPKHASLYYDTDRSELMMYDGDRHVPIVSAPAAVGDEKRGPWCVAPCRTCGVQVRSFREPTDTRPIYCGDCPNPHNVGGAKCLVEGCRIGIFEDEVFCSRCIKDPVIWSSLLGGLGALCLAARGATLVLSVPYHLQAFYLVGMFLIAVKAVRMILKGARGR